MVGHVKIPSNTTIRAFANQSCYIQQIVSDPSPKVPPRKPNTSAASSNCSQTRAHSHRVASSGSLSADRKAGTACDDPRWETIRFANANCGDRYLYVAGK